MGKTEGVKTRDRRIAARGKCERGRAKPADDGEKTLEECTWKI